MAKLSQQFAEEREKLQQQRRPTRTQRVGQQQAQQRYELEKQRFEELKAQAKKIQEEKFKDQVVEVEERYNIYRPKEYSQRDWDRMSQRNKDAIMRQWQKGRGEDYYYSKGYLVVHSTGTRKVQKTIPFTLEDTGDQDYSYKDVYESLSPELKQFFDTPDVVLQQKAERIETTKTTVQQKLSYADQKIAEAKAKYKQKSQEYQDWWSRKSSKYRSDPKNRERRNERERDMENDLDEDIAKWQGYKEGLSKGFKELEQNKDVQFSDIERYAWDVADYEERREEARNEQRDYEYKQKQEIKKLEEGGYKPYIIEKSFKGNPESVALSYYNAETGDWKNITEVKTKGKLNVKDLEKIGYSDPQQRTLEFAGKEYKFKSRVGIYKESDGDIVTPYGKTGFTEQQLIKQSQDQAYKDWQSTQKDKPIKLPFKTIPAKDLPFGYGGQQTIMTDGMGKEIKPSVLISEKDYYLREDQQTIFGKGWDKVKQGFNWVDERVNWDFSLTGSPSMPKVSIISFGKKDEPKPNIFDKGIEGLEGTGKSVEEWVIGKDKIQEYESGLETKYQSEYQSAFESKYMKDLIYNQTDFEKASAQFMKSDEAKIIQKKYQEEYATGYKDLQTDVDFWKGTAGGVAQTGIGLGSFGLGAIKSPTRTALTVGAVYTGVGVLKALPTSVNLGLTAGLGAYGTYKFIDPESTYIERGGGLVTAVISGSILAKAGYQYLKSPVVKTVAIKPPKASLKASEVIGRDLKIITNKGTVNKVIFENQKLSQYAQAGRRTVVTTKWRALTNKYLGTNLKNIYEGIPTASGGTAYKIDSLRGSYTVQAKPSGYQKALKLLKDYGWSDAQAKATLRYYAPRVTEQYLSRGVLTVKGSKAVGEFEYLTKRPIIDVDKSLGIKTRGGSTIKDVYDVERKLINIKGTNVILERKSALSSVLDKSGRLKEFKSFQYSKSINIGKSTDLQKGWEYKKVGDLDVFKEAQFRDIYSVSLERNLFPRDNILRIDAGKTKLIDQIIDLRDKGFKKYAGGKKTPFSKTFSDQIDDVAFGSGKTTVPTKQSDVQKIINKLDDIGSTPSPKQSQYYGTGMYERSDVYGGFTPTQMRELGLQQLKSVPVPNQIKAINLKDLIKVKIDTLSGLQVGQLTAIKTATGLKSDFKLKSDLKASNQLKSLLKEDLQVKVAQQPALKTSTALKSQLKSLLDIGSVSPSLRSPTITRPPRIPDIKPPIPKPFVIPFLKAEISKRSRKSKGKSVDELAYLPDFTTRALGLEAETVSEKQAQKKLKKLLTGLEIRRGVKVKW